MNTTEAARATDNDGRWTAVGAPPWRAPAPPPLPRPVIQFAPPVFAPAWPADGQEALQEEIKRLREELVRLRREVRQLRRQLAQRDGP